MVKYQLHLLREREVDKEPKKILKRKTLQVGTRIFQKFIENLLQTECLDVYSVYIHQIWMLSIRQIETSSACLSFHQQQTTTTEKETEKKHRLIIVIIIIHYDYSMCIYVSKMYKSHVSYTI